jgi:hypothetical protein
MNLGVHRKSSSFMFFFSLKKIFTGGSHHPIRAYVCVVNNLGIDPQDICVCRVIATDGDARDNKSIHVIIMRSHRLDRSIDPPRPLLPPPPPPPVGNEMSAPHMHHL